MAAPWLRIINPTNNIRTMTIGRSQYFLLEPKSSMSLTNKSMIDNI